MLVCACEFTSVMSDSLQSYGLQPPRLLCPRNSPGKNTGVGCHALLQGIFPTRGSNRISSPALAGGFFTTRATWEAPVHPKMFIYPNKKLSTICQHPTLLFRNSSLVTTAIDQSSYRPAIVTTSVWAETLNKNTLPHY